MNDYPRNSLKVNPATGDIAIRTQFADQGTYSGMAWLVATSNTGAHNASSVDVADWLDIETLTHPA